MGIDVEGMTWRDVAKCDQACAQRGLAISGALDGNGLQETVRGGGRGQQGEAGQSPQSARLTVSTARMPAG